MEIKTDGLLLRSTDIGENDKMVTLLTADLGKIGARMKGVKKAGAKLRFAAQPFCFAEYVLTEKCGRRTVISASIYDGFFSLRESLPAFYGAAVVSETCDRIALEAMDCRELLVCAAEALRGLCERESAAVMVQFLLGALAFAGYPVRADNCFYCKRELSGRMRFDLTCGAFACESCKKGVPVSEITYHVIRDALKGEHSGDQDGKLRALRLLSEYFSQKMGARLRAFDDFINLF